MTNRPLTPQLSIGNGQTLNHDVAALWNGLVEEILREDGLRIDPTQGTRSWDEQYQFWWGYQQKLAGNRSYSSYNPAWHPDDPRANHVAGKCVDAGSGVGFVNSPQAKAFRRRCAKWGVRFTVPGEPWHVQIERAWANPDILRLIDNPQTPNPTPLPSKDTAMHPFLIQRRDSKNKELAICGLPGRGAVVIRDEPHYIEIVNAFNSQGVLISIRDGALVNLPSFRSLIAGTHFVALSETGWVETMNLFLPQK